MIEIIASVLVGVVVFIIFIALAFHNYNERNILKDVYEKLLSERIKESAIYKSRTELLEGLLEDIELIKLEQILLVTTDDDERAKIEELIRIIKEVIPNDKEI